MRLFGKGPALLLSVAALAACGETTREPPTQPTAPEPPPAKTEAPAPAGPAARVHTGLDRATFNKVAVRLNQPVYWASDADGDKTIDPDEIVTLLFYPTSPKWTEGGAFTPAFEKVFDQIVEASSKSPTGADAARQKLVQQELDDAASVLVRTDLRKEDAETKEVVRRVMTAASLVDQIFFTQTGASTVASKIAADSESASLFRRNWGPRCLTPKLEKNEACTAVGGGAKMLVDIYPADVQKDPGFCKKLEADKDSKTLLSPFVTVRQGKDGKLAAVPYNQAYGDLMRKVATELRGAADAVKDPKEEPFRAYLRAAAGSFETNDWQPADEAWAKMNARNSKYYLRIAPDETYWEPCSQKAGFHVSFALIDQSSLGLQDKLAPVQQQMEDDLAKTIGEPYKARKVTFHLPDFIRIVLNAGDSRDPIGGTIGQSLPNWGPVANEGRGRTVAMINLYTDPDSMGVRRAKAASLLSKEMMGFYADDPSLSNLSTVLHEATHNLGPAHEYKIKGKKDDEAFGGDLASMLEELKAQSGALYYLPWAQKKGVFTEEQVKKAWVDSIVWGLNHISRGMYAANGQRKAYSQLAAIQVGFLMEEGALTWDPKAKAANGTDDGAFKIDFAKMGPAVDKLMKTVGSIKAKGDKPAALALAGKYVDGERVPQKTIAERMLRFPQPNFVYAIDW